MSYLINHFNFYWNINVFSAVKWLITVNRFQNKIFWLLNRCVCTVYIYYEHINIFIYIYILSECAGNEGARRHGDRTEGLQGGARSRTHGGSGDSGGHGGTASEAVAPAPAQASSAGALLPPPPKISLGKVGARSGTWGRTGGTDSWGRSGNADTARRFRGAGTGGRWWGAGSGVRWRGAGTGLGWATTGRLAILAAGRLGRAADDGGLVLARGRTLSRHRRIPSLHLIPVVSGRSTGWWKLAPCQNSERMVASSNAVAAASPQNSREYSPSGRSWQARAQNRAAVSIAAKGKTKKLSKTRKQKGRRGVAYSFSGRLLIVIPDVLCLPTLPVFHVFIQ